MLAGVPAGVVIEPIKYANGFAALRLLIATSCFGLLFYLTTGIGLASATTVFLLTRCRRRIPMARKSRTAADHPPRDESSLWLYIGLSLTLAELLLWSEKQRRTATAIA